jgi:hypothetical protein
MNERNYIMSTRRLFNFKIIIIIVTALVMPLSAAWQLVSDYSMDGDYTAAVPGSGTALVDDGPAGSDLYTVVVGATYPDSQPQLVSGGFDVSANAFSFDASQGDTLHGPWTSNLMEGFKIEFYFKDSGSQTNPYPRLCRIDSAGSISAGGFKIEGNASGGELTAIKLWMYPNDTNCSISGNWNDGQWHYVSAEYDPADGVMILTVDEVQATAPYSNDRSVVPDKIKFGYPYDDDSSGLERGFDGLIDNVKVYKRIITYAPYTSYSMDGSYDRNAGTGTALSDGGPISSNPLSLYGEAVENAPVQDVSGYNGEAFSFDGIEPQMLTSDFTMDMTAGFIGKLKIKSDAVYDPVQAYPYLLRMSGGSTLLLQGIYQTEPNRFDNLYMSFAGNITASTPAPGGSGYNDGQWYSITFGFEPGASSGWTFLHINDDTDLDSYKMGASAVSSNTAMTIGATESLNNRYGYSGLIDELEFYYALPLTDVLTPQAGEVLYGDDAYNITWDADIHLDDAQVMIEYSSDAGASWNSVATVGNSGSYLWTVPAAIESDQCNLRITSASNTDMVYAVGSVFTILQECLVTGDLNGDCYVDYSDLAYMAGQWLE